MPRWASSTLKQQFRFDRLRVLEDHDHNQQYHDGNRYGF
jgi:hypothetical protein